LRLDQAGWLTGEMLFAALNSARLTIGREILRRVPERVVFGPSPVAGLTVSQSQGQLKLELRVSGPVTATIQSAWNTSSMLAHHSPEARFSSGFWQGMHTDHQRWVVGSAAIFAMSAAKSPPVYSK